MKRRNRRLKWNVLLGWLAVNGWIAVPAEVAKLPLTTAMVVEALRVRGVEIEAADVHLPMSLYVAGQSSTLAVVGAEREGGGRLHVRLRCVKVSDCVPFTAVLDVEEREAGQILGLVPPNFSRSPEEGGSKRIAMLHAGDHLALSIRQAHLAMQMPCLAVDTGAMGETIRVSTLDRRKIFRAIVTGPAAATGVAE